MVLIKLSTPDAFAFLQDESAPRELRMAFLLSTLPAQVLCLEPGLDVSYL
jgi:hypothetical protein